MPHSYAETANLDCPACGHAFTAEIWLLVDGAERPDLLARLREGRLHTVTCPHCGHEGEVDAPVLVFRPHPHPRRPRQRPLPLSQKEKGRG